MSLSSNNDLVHLPIWWRYFLAALALLPLAIFLYDPNQLLLEHHSFRQTQTALTTYWIIHGGFSLDYITPVLGYPWSVPLEFPFYQLIVASLVEFTGWPLDFTGRAVSLFFYYLTLVPVYYIVRPYGSIAIGVCFAILFTSPIEIFFARTFLIETLGNLLFVTALAFYFGYLRHQKIVAIFLFAIIGSIAGLQKVTTFLPVIMVCVFDACLDIYRHRSDGFVFSKKRMLVVFLMCLSMIPSVMWVWHSDHVKEAGLLSSFVTSSALRDWNFGSIALRLDIEYWLKVFGYRLVLLGGFSVALLWFVRNVFRCSFHIGRETLLLIPIGLCGPLIFGKLFYIHDYYYMAAIVFLACGTAIAVANSNGVGNGRLSVRAGAMLILLAVVNLSIFAGKYLEKLHQIPDADRLSHNIARYLNSKVSPNDVIVVVGLDWNSTIPYYSERYALMVPTWMPAYKRVISNPVDFIGKRRVGAIVQCNSYGWGLDSLGSINLFKTIEGQVEEFGLCKVKVANK